MNTNDTQNNTIQVFSDDNIPNRLASRFSVNIITAIVVPNMYFDLVINTLRGNNLQNQRYTYKTVVRKKDVVIGVQFANPR